MLAERNYLVAVAQVHGGLEKTLDSSDYGSEAKANIQTSRPTGWLKECVDLPTKTS